MSELVTQFPAVPVMTSFAIVKPTPHQWAVSLNSPQGIMM